MDILLNEIINLTQEERKDYEICLNNAPWEGIYSFSDNEKRLLEHIGWKKSADKERSFRNLNTKYCLQFLRLDNIGATDQWLFLGAFENHGVYKKANGDEVHKLTRLERFSSFSEKLIIEYKKHQGDKQAKINIDYLDSLKVIKILEKVYVNVNKPFEGYDKVSLSYKELKALIEHNVTNWRELLSNIQCVYVITDTKTGKLYVGSTYGHAGTWQRWSCYISMQGTGGDVGLIELLKENPKRAEDFKFTILESFINNKLLDSKLILDREDYWKKALCTREHGYNHN